MYFPGKLLSAGYSSLGILLSMLLGTVAVIALFFVGRMRSRGDMVVAGSCSAVIAAACQNDGSEEVERFWTGRVMWVRCGGGGGKMGWRDLGGNEVQNPRDGVAYKQPSALS
jgi:hypothetical protein